MLLHRKTLSLWALQAPTNSLIRVLFPLKPLRRTPRMVRTAVNKSFHWASFVYTPNTTNESPL